MSVNPRILHGKVPKGKKRSFLDQAEHHGKTSCPPGAGTYRPDQASNLCDRLDPAIKGGPSWARSAEKSKSRITKPAEIGPNHYNPDWKPLENREANYTVPKDKDNDFITKAVKE